MTDEQINAGHLRGLPDLFIRTSLRDWPGPPTLERNQPSGRLGLWIASIAALASALSPYYIGHIAAAFVHSQPPVTSTNPASEGTASEATLEFVTVPVEGMDCSSCEMPIKVALEKTQGVRSANVSYEHGNAEIKYAPRQTDTNQLRRAIELTGYKAEWYTLVMKTTDRIPYNVLSGMGRCERSSGSTLLRRRGLVDNEKASEQGRG